MKGENTIEYELAYGRRYPAKGAEGEKDSLKAIPKLSGKRTTTGRTSGETWA